MKVLGNEKSGIFENKTSRAGREFEKFLLEVHFAKKFLSLKDY
jgi:hypothetical protein